MKKTCPLCKKRLAETMCSHSTLLKYGYYHPDGNFYLSDSKGMRKDAQRIGIDYVQFIEPVVSYTKMKGGDPISGNPQREAD